ncbi:MAG: zinc ribbon domain-containing protein [bacterium]|nr:zinc ribbon domain-containing protein [bacterium]
MPTYEYECTACGGRFERRQRMADPPVAACPACGGGVRRLISGGAGIILKREGRGGACSLEQAGRTCCGREERCDAPPCGE